MFATAVVLSCMAMSSKRCHLLPVVLSAATATLAACAGCEFGAHRAPLSAHGATAPVPDGHHEHIKQPKPLGHAWAADVTPAALRRLHRLVNLRGLHWTAGAAPRQCVMSSACCWGVVGINKPAAPCPPCAPSLIAVRNPAFALHLIAGLEMQETQPLRFQQLTRLQLQDSRMAASDILIAISELPRLEILEVRNCTDPGFELLAFDAAALSRLPKLRLVDLSWSVLWAHTSGHEGVPGDDVQKYLPLRVVQHLVSLQRANPAIEWVQGNDLGH